MATDYNEAIKELNQHCENYYFNMLNSFHEHKAHTPLEPSVNIKDFLKDKSKEEKEAIMIDAKRKYLADKSAGWDMVNENAFDTILQTVVLGQVEKSKITVPETKIETEKKSSNHISKGLDARTKQWAADERARRNKDVYEKYNPLTGESSSEYASKYKKTGNGDVVKGLVKNTIQQSKNEEAAKQAWAKREKTVGSKQTYIEKVNLQKGNYEHAKGYGWIPKRTTPKF